jgi:hypothetical protein
VAVDLCDEPLFQEDISTVRLHFVDRTGGGLSSWTLRGLTHSETAPLARHQRSVCFLITAGYSLLPQRLLAKP